LPILEEIFKEKKNNPNTILRGLILVPTRELTKQIIKAIDDYSKYMPIKRVAIFGGISAKNQEKKIANGIDIAVCTTGRLIEHLKNKTINLSSVTNVVIDELDTMLDMEFLEDIEKVLPNIGINRQIMMFSATINPSIKKLAKKFLNDPVVIEVTNQRSSVKSINQQIILVDENKKQELLSYLIGFKNFSQVLVFVNHKVQADSLIETLNLDGLKSACIHSDIRQSSRALFLRKFKEKELRVLVATDIAARGIDIQELPVVINYSLPKTIIDFTHRIGRTGRTGKKGLAITLLSINDYEIMAKIEKELKLNIPRSEIESFEIMQKRPRNKKPKSLSQKKPEIKTKKKNENKKVSKFRKPSKRS